MYKCSRLVIRICPYPDLLWNHGLRISVIHDIITVCCNRGCCDNSDSAASDGVSKSDGIQILITVLCCTRCLLTFYFKITSSYWKSGGEEPASRGMPRWSFSQISDLKPSALMRHKNLRGQAAFKTNAVSLNNSCFYRSYLFQNKMVLLCFTELLLFSPLDLCGLSANSIAGIVVSQIFLPFKVLSLGS